MNSTTKTSRRVVAFLCPAIVALFGSGTVLSQTTSSLVLPLSRTPASKSTAADREHRKAPNGVSFCRYQEKHVKGVTHPKGLQLSETGPVNYYILTPAFTLTSKHVKKCELIDTPQPAISDLDYTTLHIEFSDHGRAEMFEAFKDIEPVSFVMVVNERAFPVRISFRAKSVEETRESVSLGYFVDREFGQSFVDVLNPKGVPTPYERLNQLYFPTVVGTKRVMQTMVGESKTNDITETVSRVEKQDGKYIITLNRENPRGEGGREDRFFEHEYELSSKGLFSLSTANDANPATPEPLLMLPGNVAKMWTHEDFDASRGLTRIANFTCWGEQVAEVPAGKFKAIAVHKQYTWKRDGNPVRKQKVITWYALGVGVVKQVSDTDGEETVAELKEFTRGKAK